MLAFFEFFNRGGWVMYVILAVSVYTVGIIVYKLWQFARLKLSQSAQVEVLLAQLLEQSEQHALKEMVAARLKNLMHPLARFLESGLVFSMQRAVSAEELKEEMARVGARELSQMETHLRGLDLAANLAPLLGLLGMVLSMVTVFSTIEAAGARVDVTVLAGGIWEALLTTVFGLIVAVVAQVGYYHLDSRVEKTRLRMNDAGTRLVHYLTPQAG